ncbi:MAG: lipopolysaccharide kinase InaA family protein [Desulfuromonadaceae bacterium]
MTRLDFSGIRWQFLGEAEDRDFIETLATAPRTILTTNAKRTVYLIAPYVLKVYHYRSPLERIKKLLADGALQEWTLSARLFRAGVPVPRPVAFGTAGCRSLIVTRYIESSVTAAEFIRQQWPELPRPQRHRAMESFARFILGLFQAGLVQSDFNLGNLLVTDGGNGYYAIDLQRARHLGRPLSVLEMADNLAYLLPCFMRLSNRDRLHFFSICRKTVPELATHGNGIEERAFAMMRRQWRKKTPRKLRASAAKEHYFEEGRIRGYLGAGPEETLKQILTADPDRLFELAVRELKNDRRSRVALIEHRDRSLVLKYHKIKNFWHRLRQPVQPRSRRIWNATRLFAARALPTAELLAVVDIGQGFGYRGTLAVYDYLEGVADSKRSLQEDYLRTPLRPLALRNLADFLWEMHRRGIYHGDAKISNFVWEGESPSLRAIDLDGVRFLNRVTDGQRLDDLKNLAASLVWWDGDERLTAELLSAYIRRHRPWQKRSGYWLARLKKQVARQLEHRQKRQKPPTTG